jgi:threonine/homoserine/homoserine lactone efflux protein
VPVELVTLLAFIPAAIALNLTPGADMMFCLGQGLRGGPRAGMAANFGIASGAMVHVAVAGLGLGALVAATPWIFDVVRWVGVAYLLYLAVGALRSRALPVAPDMTVKTSRAFREAFIVNLTNPKVILFVLAFVPQFVNPANGLILVQFLIFGVIMSIGGLLVNGFVGVFAGSVGKRLAASAGFARGLGFVSGAIFVGLAVRLAMLEKA